MEWTNCSKMKFHDIFVKGSKMTYSSWLMPSVLRKCHKTAEKRKTISLRLVTTLSKLVSWWSCKAFIQAINILLMWNFNFSACHCRTVVNHKHSEITFFVFSLLSFHFWFSGVVGGGVPPETSDWEISADLPGKRGKGKGVKIEKKRKKIVNGKV